MATLPSPDPQRLSQVHVLRRKQNGPTSTARQKSRWGKWAGPLFALVVFASWFVLTAKNAQNDIGQIIPQRGLPVIEVAPRTQTKGNVTLGWSEMTKEWRWKNPSTGTLEAVPDGFFDDGREGWWIARTEPKFGTREAWMFGIGAKIGSWHWTGKEWAGTGTPPFATH